MYVPAISAAERPAPSVRSNLPASRRLRLSGTPAEIGWQHGAQLRDSIHRFLGDRRARLEALLPRAEANAGIDAEVRRYRAVIEHHLPAMAQELHGLAEGAAITLHEAYLLQLRRELVGYQEVPARGDCTTFARLPRDGVPMLGQTIDLNGAMEPELTVLEIAHAEPERRLALVSFTGLLGYLGLNQHGLAIGLNLVLGGRWGPGIPGYMLIRHLLDQARSAEEALELLKDLPRASSRALTLLDRRRLITVEYLPDGMEVLEGRELVHANHFLHPMLQLEDKLNPFARTSSLRRHRACLEGLQKLPPDADPADCLALLAAPPIDVPPNEDPRRECTVASVLMRLDSLTLYVRQRGGDAALH